MRCSPGANDGAHAGNKNSAQGFSVNRYLQHETPLVIRHRLSRPCMRDSNMRPRGHKSTACAGAVAISARTMTLSATARAEVVNIVLEGLLQTFLADQMGHKQDPESPDGEHEAQSSD